MRFNVVDPDSFFAATAALDMSVVLERFLARVPDGGEILDAGCGSGRDSRAMLDRGYRVLAMDAHPELCRLAAERLGVPAVCTTFQEVDWRARFDGVWACASLLHLAPGELPDALARLTRALKPGGVLYASFKHGEGVRTDRAGRYFNDQTPCSLAALVAATPGLGLIETFASEDLVPNRNARWINLLATRA